MNILITGEKSYVGLRLKDWLMHSYEPYNIDVVSLRNENWRSIDLSTYDVIFHVAAIVHKKEKPDSENIYYKVNKELTIELAEKAKKSGVKQFIFMSTLSVYGIEGKMNQKVIINNSTPCIPNSLYGKSKLEAEIALNELNDLQFKVAIIRAPMIYGPKCPGNYVRLRKLAIKVPIFPLVNNLRSMIFIDNLSEFIKILIEKQDSGLFFPQNKELVNTSTMVKLIAQENSRKIYLSVILGISIKLIGNRIKLLNKVFGSLIIDPSLSNYKNLSYSVVNLKNSIENSEQNKVKGVKS
ncbi:NAD-dependent epimerase/dehydratase family protein [Peribacillus sp. FSL E2-0159]|uniref:NAD-dependent epimerase/dehydratase family protein n=1 Tax=Peribacillus sp. FSL E2-0159 TaxID=2975289 RepID=UPI00315A55C3